MKKLIVAALLGFVLSGCGGGSDASDSSAGTNGGSAPAISNLQFSSRSATVNQGGGRVTVRGTIDFFDKDGNIASLTILGEGSTTTAIEEKTGNTSGVVTIGAFVDTDVAKDFPFSIFITDATRLESNKLTGIFTVS